MTALGLVTLVIVIFFLIGIGVGVIAVVALAVTRRHRAARWAEPRRRAPDGETGGRGSRDDSSGRTDIADPGDDEIGDDEFPCDDTRPLGPGSGYRTLDERRAPGDMVIRT